MQKEIKPLKIKAEIMWAYLNERNELSNAYQVDLCNLSKAAVDALADLGIEAKHKEDKGFYITGKSKNFPIEALRTDGSRIPESTKVGNGSKATVVVAPYEWKFKNKKGVSPSIKKLVINELVEYVGGGSDADAVDVDGDIRDMESDVL
jgi:hypothetical protein